MTNKLMSKAEFAKKLLKGEINPEDYLEQSDQQGVMAQPKDPMKALSKATSIQSGKTLMDKIADFLGGEENMMGKTGPEKALEVLDQATNPTRPNQPEGMKISGIPMGPKGLKGIKEGLDNLTGMVKDRRGSGGTEKFGLPKLRASEKHIVEDDERFGEIMKGFNFGQKTPPQSDKFLPARHPNRQTPVTEPEPKSLGSGVQSQIPAKVAKKPIDAIREVERLTKQNQGVTFNLFEGDLAGTDYFAVAVFPERTVIQKGAPNQASIAKFVNKNQDVLNNPEYSLGTWYDSEKDEFVLDVVRTVKDKNEAVKIGQQFDQDAIFDLKSLSEIRLKGNAGLAQ